MTGDPSSPTAAPPARDDLWHHADFLRLWAAQAISAFGSRITRTALPIIAVITLGQSEAIVGVLAAMQLFPGLILAILAGGMVDRGRKRRILITADLIRAALVASLTAAWALGLLSEAHGTGAMLHVIVVGAGVGAATALFQITDVAYLPSLIGRRRLADGNAKLETTEAIAEITGPASAGALIGALGAPLAVAIDAASYVWSAVMLGRIRGDARDRSERSAPPPPVSDAAGAAELDAAASAMRTGRDFQIGMHAVFGHAMVRPLVLTLMLWSIVGGFFIALYTPFCLRTIGLSERTFGVIIAMGGVGSLGGAVLGRSLARALGVGRTLLATASLSLVCTLFIPIAASGTSRAMAIGFLVAHQLLGDGFSVAFVVLAVTLRQTVLPREVLGRANAAIYVSTTGVLIIAAVLAGALASLIGIRAAVWIGLSIGLIAPAFLWPLRHLRNLPAGQLGASDPAIASGESRD
ncbi:MAG: MFS transporter [Deltaproteobacteria bacterium]|nr:MAG: MFS transporter [Deltaproteobacteria bacterium]TMQ17164.1 MAG: MFS transporter [Deltaproteobacteria bacterium]